MTVELLEDDDIFESHAEWFAGIARIMFWAQNAKDGKAIEIASFYFEDHLSKVLSRHLTLCDPDWNNLSTILDPAKYRATYRRFDGFRGDYEFPAPGKMRFWGEVYWLIGENGNYDPFFCVIDLCAKTGTFLRYAIQFGDFREDKEAKSVAPGVPIGAWRYEFEKRRLIPAKVMKR